MNFNRSNSLLSSNKFGYIKTVDNKLISFKEKPTSESAKKYLSNEDKKYLWNSGVLYFKRVKMLDEINNNYSQIVTEVKNILINSEHKDNIINLNKSLYSNIESISIDYGILKSTRMDM